MSSIVTTIHGLEEKDRLIGGSESEVLIAYAGDDRVTAGDGDDTLLGGEGNDNLRGEEGNDSLVGDVGNDRLHGGNGNDFLSGGEGNDALTGSTGNDTLEGGNGDDSLSGGNGDDILSSGLGNDTLRGGGGKDTYIIAKSEGSSDIIADFRANHGDSIDLTRFEIGRFVDMNMAEVDGDVVINLGDEQTLTLQNTSMNDLNGNHFTGFTGIVPPPTNHIENGSFEINALPGRGWGVFTDGMPGWHVSDRGATGYEVQYGNLTGVSATDGSYKLELDSHNWRGPDSNSGIYQDVATSTNDSYELSFDFYARVRGHEDTNTIEVYWNNELLLTINGTEETLEGASLTHHENGWKTVSVMVDGSTDADTTRLEFLAAGKDDSYGGYIDNVKLFNVVKEQTEYALEPTTADDHLLGTDGNDTIRALKGNDTVEGGDGDDRLVGQAGNDVLDGGAGDDSLNGSNGDDILVGGTGNDRLNGGNGSDNFIFTDGDGNDRVQNFNASDTLTFSNVTDFNTAEDVLAASSVIGNQTQITYNGGTVTIQNYTDLSASDIVIM